MFYNSFYTFSISTSSSPHTDLNYFTQEASLQPETGLAAVTDIFQTLKGHIANQPHLLVSKAFCLKVGEKDSRIKSA